MTLEEYCKIGSSETYARWLESGTVQLGSIWGGTSFKFGIYGRNPDGKPLPTEKYGYDGTFAWVLKYGDSAQAAFEVIHTGIIAAAEAARRGDILAIESLQIPPALKWKTAFLYQDHAKPAIVSIYARDALLYLAFGDPSARRSLGEAYTAIIAKKPTGTDIHEYGHQEWHRWVEFQGSVRGLIASDGLKWKEETRASLEKTKKAVIWWSKKPSGKTPVASQLKKLVMGGNGFPFYFTRNKKVSHKAHVIDIAFADDYDSKKSGWIGADGYKDDFADYAEGEKDAAIAFLIDGMKLLDGSLTPTDFTYWGNLAAPTQDNLQPFVSVRLQSEDEEEESGEEPTTPDLPSKNMIFYGPPGTGKTYHLCKDLFELFTSVSAGKSRAKWLLEEASEMSWWKVIAAALLAGGPSTVPNLVKHEFMAAKIATTNQATPSAMAWAMLQQHAFLDCEFVKYANRTDPQLFRKDAESHWLVDEKAVRDNVPEVVDFIAKAVNYADEGQSIERNYEFITFHQSMSYEDFIEGIKPTLGEEEGDRGLSYEVKDGIFKRICARARLNPGRNFALFIDEINRGNVAGIFGELISLLEEDKREGAANGLRSVLPYSRELFSVPQNLYVIGTMNSADRSVEALDTALRRRFSFVEMAPRPEILTVIEGIDLTKLLETINRRLEVLRDRDHRIGHAYLMGIGSIEALKAAFAERILPLLQEYFYGDWSKLAMVLGKGFVKERTAKVTWPKDVKGEGEAATGELWTVTEMKEWTADIFKSIYE